MRVCFFGPDDYDGAGGGLRCNHEWDPTAGERWMISRDAAPPGDDADDPDGVDDADVESSESGFDLDERRVNLNV